MLDSPLLLNIVTVAFAETNDATPTMNGPITERRMWSLKPFPQKQDVSGQ